MLKFIDKLLGDANKKQIKKLWPIVNKINQIEERYQQEIQSDEDIKTKTAEFKARIAGGESLDKLLPEAFALVKNACRRLQGREFELQKNFENKEEGTQKYTWNMVPFDVQLLGGIILHQGKIAEMKTGEGKTLVSTAPLYLNALKGEGAFWLLLMNIWHKEIPNGWECFIASSASKLASISIKRIEIKKNPPMPATLLMVPTANLALTTSATTWPQRLNRSFNANYISPL
jgi:hypothetical protein